MSRPRAPADHRDSAFVGRDELVGRIVATLTNTSDAPHGALVEGEAGIGKTWLVRRAAERAEHEGAIVCVGTADPLARESSLAPIIAAVERLLGDDDESRCVMQAANDVVQPGAPDRAGIRIERIGDLLEARATRSPIALVVEDIQWADAATLQAVQQYLLRFRDLAVTVVATRRTPPASVSIELDAVLRRFSEVGAAVVEVPPMTSAELESLARSTSKCPADSALLGLLGRTGGNPFYAAELLRAGLADGTIIVDGQRLVLVGDQLPPALQIVLLRRMAVLPAETRQLLRLASLFGTQFDASDVAALSGLKMSELLRTLEPARAEAVIADLDGRLVFRHELLRAAVYDDIPKSMRVGLHREAAATLVAEGAPALRVALQYAAEAETGDSDAVMWLHRAFREEMQRSVAVAVDLLMRAISLCTPGSDEWFRMVVEVLEPLNWIGRISETEGLARQALAYDPNVATRFGLLNGLAGSFSGEFLRFPEAIATMQSACAIVGLSDQDLALAKSSLALMSVGTAYRFDADWGEALALARDARNDYAVALALTAGAFACSASGELESAAELASECEILHATTAMPPWGRSNPSWILGLLSIECDDFDAASTRLGAARRSAEDAGNVLWLPFVRAGLVGLAYMSGDFERAYVECVTAIAASSEQRTTVVSTYHRVILARIATHRGQLDDAARHIAIAEQTYMETGPTLGFDWAMWTKAMLADANGDSDTAFTIADTGWRLTEPVRYLFSWRTLAPDLVRLAVPRDRERALEVVADVELGARRAQTAGAAATAQWCRGLVEGDADLLSRAVEALALTPRRVDEARARIDAAEALGRRRATDGAAAHLDRAADIFEGLSAGYELATIAGMRRAFGLKVRARRVRPTFGWESLTPTEHEVAVMVADGLTNPQAGARLGISRRTVETHVSHMLTKLGLTSRVQLATEVTRRASSG